MPPNNGAELGGPNDLWVPTPLIKLFKNDFMQVLLLGCFYQKDVAM